MSVILYSSTDESVMSEINMTPLIDVMLVLLIIFIVTLPVVHNAVSVQLPTAAARPVESKSQDIDISVKADASVLWNKELVDGDALRQHIAAAARRVEQPAINLSADENVPYGAVASVMADLQSGGLNKLNLVTQSPKQRD